MSWRSGLRSRADEHVTAISGPGETVEKLMSFTRAEFEIGIERLTGTPPRLNADHAYDLSGAAGGRLVICSFEPRADALLGGLVRLPRVLVTLRLNGLPIEERAEFVARFDRTFQRGGG